MKKKKSVGRRIFGILVGTVFGVFVAALLCVFFYGKHLLNQINYVDKEEQSYLSSEEVSVYMETTEPEDIDPELETLVEDRKSVV